MATREELLQAIFSTLDAQHRLLHSLSSQRFMKFGLAPSQLKILTALAYNSECNPKDLAEQMYLTPGAVSQLTEPLEQSKLISRKQDKNDRRKVYLKLTGAGKSKLASINRTKRKFLTSALESLNDDELANFAQILNKMFENFKTEQQKD